MSADARKAFIRQFVQATDARDPGAITAAFAEDAIAYLPGVPGPLDRTGLERVIAQFYAAFPDLRHEILGQVAEGDRVASIVTVRGTHRGDFNGIPPTGRSVAMTCIAISRFANGRIVWQRVQGDTLGLMQQIGVIPAAPGAAPSPADTSPRVRTPGGPPASPDQRAAHKAAVRRFFDEVNRGGWDAIDALCAPDVAIYHPPTPGPLDLATGKLYAGTFWSAFPNCRITIEDQIAEGDTVVSHGVYEGTHRGDFNGIPPTGRSITMTWTSVDRFADGTIAERWVEQDALGLLQQIGVIPTAPAAAGP